MKLNRRNILLAVMPLFVMVLPNLKLPIDAFPLYIGTCVYMLLFLYYRSGQNHLRNRIIYLLAIFFLFTILSAVYEMLRYHEVAESLYMIIQYGLGMSFLITLPNLIRNENDLEILLRWSFIGLIINSLICICFALPFTGNLIQQTLFSKTWLYPPQSRLEGHLAIDRLTSGRTFRGQTLFGNANSSGLTIIIGMVLTLIYFQFIKNKKNSLVLAVTLIVALIALILTQSRSDYLSLIGVVVFLYANKSGRHLRKYFTFGIVIIILILVKVGVNNSSYTDFSRVTSTIDMVSGEQEFGYSEQARVLAYTQFIGYLEEYPRLFVVGKGISGSAIARYTGANVKQEISLEGGLNHFFFASIFYERGLIAAIVFTILMLVILNYLFINPPKQEKQNPIINGSRMLLISIFVPLMVTHYFTDDDHGAFLFFFILALALIFPKIKLSKI